jgi:hypothetical protein
MIKRFILLLLVLVLGISVVGAQESTVFCGDLSADDCDLLVKSNEAMSALQTVAFDFDGSFAMGGFEISPGMDSVEIGANGNGALNTDFASLDDFQAQLSLHADVPSELLGEGMPALDLDLIMVDGILYLDAGPMMGMQGMSMWMGLDLAALLEQYAGMSLDDLTNMEGMMGGMDFSGLEGMDQGEYATITRLGDEQVMGQTVAVFETTLDFSGMFSSESFRAIYGEIMAATLAMQGMDMDTMGMDMDTFMDMLGTMFDDMEFSTQEWVGLDDFYMHHGSIYMDMSLDMKAMMSAMGVPAEPDMPASITMTFEGELNLHDFNAPLNIVAPEGAQIIDPSMFMGMGDF